MRLSQHIGRAVSEHAATDGASKKRKRAGATARKPGGRMLSAVRSHRIFVPLLTTWSALLLGLVMLVVPDTLIARIPALTGVEVPLLVLRAVVATIFATLGGVLGFVVASAMRIPPVTGDKDASVITALKSRKPHADMDVRPIDPATELGSESLDAPFEEAELEAWSPIDDADEEQGADTLDTLQPDREPTLGELSQRGYEIEAPEAFDTDDAQDERKGGWAFTRSHFKDALIESCEGASCEAAPTPPTERPAEPSAQRPRELDLGQFGALPGRNAVWVEEPAPVQQPEPTPITTRRAAPMPASALEKLRQTPPEELSLVEMVERFAAALHDHQNKQRTVAATPGRDAALAEALKALSLFTERGFDREEPRAAGESQISQTERELRDALARLQDLRGAA